MYIGDVADRTGISKQTIRYWEQEELLEEPYRSPTSGYREYTPGVVHRIQFIKNAKKLGFSLDDIRELLSILEDRTDVPEAFARKLTQRKEAIEEKINKLTAIKNLLEDLLDACPEEGTARDCPCVEEIAPEGHLEEFLRPFQRENPPAD